MDMGLHTCSPQQALSKRPAARQTLKSPKSGIYNATLEDKKKHEDAHRERPEGGAARPATMFSPEFCLSRLHGRDQSLGVMLRTNQQSAKSEGRITKVRGEEIAPSPLRLAA